MVWTELRGARGAHCSGSTTILYRPGDDLLSHALRRSTISAETFHGRVRDGIGCRHLAIITRSVKNGPARSMPDPDDDVCHRLTVL